MERVYALGITCIEFVQEWFEDYEDYFVWVNDLSNPHHVLVYLFPWLSAIDSVFAAQLLLCISFGGWMNTVMKWWFLEDRPYWWVRETSFYEGGRRPVLRQYGQTCETGPGSPSGHSTTCGMLLMLGIMWISHVINDRKWSIWWWKYPAWAALGGALGSVVLARMFVAAHFPHQCLLGALFGLALAPALCLYVSDPCVWQSNSGGGGVRRAVAKHAAAAAGTAAVSAVTYLGMLACGWDPHWTVKLAFRWCENPGDIHVSTTPVYSLVQSTASLLGWALSVTPAVAEFRHYTKNRSLIISSLAVALMFYGTQYLQDHISKNSAWWYYTMQFVLAAIKPFLYLRLVPTISMWPYSSATVSTKHKKE